MNIIVGLGNPGTKYNKTRHNIGFRIIDEYARENNFPKFKLSKKHHSLLSENDGVILVKPQTFMNESGKAVKSLTKFYKDSNFIIIHDDIDLSLGKIKISKDRGSGGHKGIESIIKEIGNKNFVRLRIGIQTNEPKVTEKFVLQKFTKEEEKIIKDISQTSKKAIDSFLTKGLEKTMNEYNKGFLSIIAILLVVVLIVVLSVIIFKQNFSVNIDEKEILPDSESVNLPELPQKVNEEMQELQQNYENKISE